ncbi:MAG: dTDP-glucose 4,6-dehydratase, partial [Deltaproteobacteria bacterium]|nr:dTDP-glucose 4,6-dehydratase [Deltaproteobacteria bacterium]
LDKLTYSGNMMYLSALSASPLHRFVQGDIGDAALVGGLLEDFRPDAIVNFAAESHVDRSILDPEPFTRTNVMGLCALLQTTLCWFKTLPPAEAAAFRFLHISTDEVFGALRPDDPAFTEQTPYAPNSPYSASKAAGDHFVRAYHETYGLPTLLTNCSNNYGPRQFPEKLIPLTLLRAKVGQTLPIYGRGDNIRDWLHVEDHCAALELVLCRGRLGQTYNIGGRAERRNLDVVKDICAVLDELSPSPAGPHAALIRFVPDRPGHDFRYAVDPSKLEKELDWRRKFTFEQGLRDTIRWYLDNPAWIESAQSGEYRSWTAEQYK